MLSDSRPWPMHKKSWCGRLSNRLPMLFTLGLLGLGWFITVIAVLYSVAPTAALVVLGILWQMVFALAVWSYVRVVFTHAGQGIPPGFEPREVYPGRELADPESSTRREEGQVSYCRKCASHRLDGAHHCSICHECIEEFDHHCPWVCNCVGAGNHKFFILFLLWTGAAGLSAAAINLAFFVAHMAAGGGFMGEGGYFAPGMGIVRLIGLILCGLFGLMLVPFGVMHVQLVRDASTTLDSIAERKRTSTPESRAANYRRVFGVGVERILPISPRGPRSQGHVAVEDEDDLV